MGLFSGKKKTYVSSVVYNLAGDEKDRPQYLKSLVAGNVVTSSDFSIADTINGGYKNGPGIKLKNFFRWANTNYDLIGMPTSKLNSIADLDVDVLEEHIPHALDESVTVEQSIFDVADYFHWADQYMIMNQWNNYLTDWVSDYDEATSEIVITLEDTSTIRFTPVGFNPQGLYIYATYRISTGFEAGSLVGGSVVPLAPGADWPEVFDWDEETYSAVPRVQNLDTTVLTTVSYSDGRPNEVSSSTTSANENWTEIHGVWSKRDYLGVDNTTGKMSEEVQTMYQNQVSHVNQGIGTTSSDETIAGGVIKTTAVKTTTDSLVLDRSYRIDTQTNTLSTFEAPQVFIYEIGSGIPELDALIQEDPGTNQYFPFIPIRLNNQFIQESDPAYPLIKKAYKKSVNGKIDSLIESIADNESIDDIDYAYCVFGVSLNVKENTCRQYLYRYFEKLMDNQASSESAYNIWKARFNENDETQASWMEWLQAQSEPGSILYGTPAPSISGYAAIPTNEVSIKSTGTFATNYDIRISWQSISEETGTGQLDAARKKGDLWFVSLPSDNLGTGEIFGFSRNVVVTKYYLNWQVTANSWKRLKIIGMVHRNYIYNGKFVEIDMKEALDDPEESGFILPLHYPTYDEMSLVDATQMSTACCFIVFNCYKVVKQKWYQTGIFKILLVVAVIAITVATGGAGALSAGLLGTNAAVGAALGLSGLASIVVGAIANAIAAMIVMKIVTVFSTAVFGKKFGAIVGAVASVVAIAVGTSMMNGGSLSAGFSSLMDAKSILTMTVAAGDGVSGLINASAMKWNTKTQDLVKNYAVKTKELDELFAEEFGYGKGVINPMDLVDISDPTRSTVMAETPGFFLSRTLMTGSDIADLSMGLIGSFSELTLTTDLPSID